MGVTAHETVPVINDDWQSPPTTVPEYSGLNVLMDEGWSYDQAVEILEAFEVSERADATPEQKQRVLDLLTQTKGQDYPPTTIPGW